MSHGLRWTEDAYVAYPQQHRAHARAWTWRPGKPPDPEHTGQDLPEARRLAQGQALAQRDGSRCAHAQDSRGSEPGFPDLVFIGPSVICAALQTASGTLTEQHNLGLAMRAPAGPAGHIWRPADRPRRTARLRGDHPWPT